MNDAEFETQKARILAIIEKWHTPLGLQWWTVTHEYVRSFDEMPDGAHTISLAIARVFWPYMEANIYWNLYNATDCDDAHLERAFIHECLHILVREMRDDAGSEKIDHEERVCATLAQVILRLQAEGKPMTDG